MMFHIMQDCGMNERNLEVVIRRAVSATGLPRRAVDREIRDRKLDRTHRGIYIDPRAGDGEAAYQWHLRMAAHLARGGPNSAVSHRAAAVLHQFDGWTDPPGSATPEDLLVPFASGFHGRPAMRTRTLRPNEIMITGGLRVTTPGRTLADLGRLVGVDDMEIALESALRLPDEEPRIWNRTLLAELEARATGVGGARTGIPTLRAVLLRRPFGARPTGSIAETCGVQALRSVGLELVRQPTVRMFDTSGLKRRTAYPDLAELDYGAFLEIDGLGWHSSQKALEADLSRQNDLNEVFDVFRYPAKTVLSTPRLFAKQVAQRLANAEPRFTSEVTELRNHRVVRTDEGFDVFRR